MGWLGDKIEGLIQLILDGLQAAFDFVVDFFLDAITQLWAWLLVAVNAVLDFLWDLIDPVWEWLASFFQNLWDKTVEFFYEAYTTTKDWLIEWLGGFAGWVSDQAEAIGIDITLADLQSSLDAVANAYSTAAWLLPLNEVTAIAVGGFVAVATVRAVRWIISFIWFTG